MSPSGKPFVSPSGQLVDLAPRSSPLQSGISKFIFLVKTLGKRLDAGVGRRETSGRSLKRICPIHGASLCDLRRQV